MRARLSAILLLSLFFTASALAKSRVGPLPKGKDIAWSHAPYEVGACGVCHKSDDPKNPGPIKDKVNNLCLSCHEDMKDALKTRKQTHPPAEDACTDCHNPHNAKYKKLLIEKAPKLCFGCHSDIEEISTKSKVKHGALSTERSCLNCHNPHATDVEHLLLQLPFDLCINCHGKDGVTTPDGHKLTNMKKLLEENPVQHGPVKNKDCSACHLPHGSDNFRLLVEAYPETFYAPYNPKNYALCYRCHNNQILANPNTTTLTKFRNGDENLHYKHVHKEARGRTCRACHEVHAAKKPHQIRDSVPYGHSGWSLPVKYTPEKGGGMCEKTCHSTKKYLN